MKLKSAWYAGIFLVMAMALVAGCGGQPTCPDLQGTITSEGAGGAMPPGATPEETQEGNPANFQTGTVKITDGGDTFTWTADETSFKALDGVTVKGKIDQPGQGASRNMRDAKVDLSGDYKNCQLVVTGSLTGPTGDNRTCQGSGNWQIVCNGTKQAGGTWSAAHYPKGQPGAPAAPATPRPQQPGPQPEPQKPTPQSPAAPQPPATQPPGGEQK